MSYRLPRKAKKALKQDYLRTILETTLSRRPEDRSGSFIRRTRKNLERWARKGRAHALILARSEVPIRTYWFCNRHKQRLHQRGFLTIT